MAGPRSQPEFGRRRLSAAAAARTHSHRFHDLERADSVQSGAAHLSACHVLRAIGLFLVLLVFWLLLSGIYTPFLVGAGVGSALFAAWLGRRLAIVDAEGQPFQLGWRIFVYWLWLVRELALSAWTVARLTLHPKLPISPTLVRFKPSQQTDLGRVIHANSITLTPGTLSVECQAEEFLVHGLTREGAAACVDSAMDRWVSRCEQTR